MEFVKLCQPIFEAAIRDYHVTDSVDTPIRNPYPQGQIKHDLYLKCWIDTVQWHFEDIIRDPAIDPAAALVLKRRIDKSNQDRTDLVERIDSYFLTVYRDVKPLADATINTESPAWAIDGACITTDGCVRTSMPTLSTSQVPPPCPTRWKATRTRWPAQASRIA